MFFDVSKHIVNEKLAEDFREVFWIVNQFGKYHDNSITSLLTRCEGIRRW